MLAYAATNTPPAPCVSVLAVRFMNRPPVWLNILAPSLFWLASIDSFSSNFAKYSYAFYSLPGNLSSFSFSSWPIYLSGNSSSSFSFLTTSTFGNCFGACYFYFGFSPVFGNLAFDLVNLFSFSLTSFSMTLALCLSIKVCRGFNFNFNLLFENCDETVLYGFRLCWGETLPDCVLVSLRATRRSYEYWVLFYPIAYP